jgi:hypothetical protein
LLDKAHYHHDRPGGYRISLPNKLARIEHDRHSIDGP